MTEEVRYINRDAVPKVIDTEFFDEAAIIPEEGAEEFLEEFYGVAVTFGEIDSEGTIITKGAIKEVEVKQLEKPKTTYSQIDPGTGALLTYNDPFAQVDDKMVSRAIKVEQEIIGHVGTIQKAYIELGAALDEFEKDKLYLARQYDSFRAWTQSPEIGIDYRTAHDLIRIIREALPIIVNNDKMDMLPPVSKMRALLPTLADGEDVFLEALEAIQDLTVSESYNAIDEIRGVEKTQDGRKPFRAVVKTGDTNHVVKIYSTNPEDSYSLGILTISRSDWPKFETIFGNRVEFESISSSKLTYSPS